MNPLAVQKLIHHSILPRHHIGILLGRLPRPFCIRDRATKMPRGLSSKTSRMRWRTEFVGLVKCSVFSRGRTARRGISTFVDLVCCGLETRDFARELKDVGASWEEKSGDRVAHITGDWGR